LGPLEKQQTLGEKKTKPFAQFQVLIGGGNKNLLDSGKKTRAFCGDSGGGTGFRWELLKKKVGDGCARGMKHEPSGGEFKRETNFAHRGFWNLLEIQKLGGGGDFLLQRGANEEILPCMRNFQEGIKKS